ncbi:MAG TPA: ribonuclease P protein component [Anaerolineales bacterium]
MQRKFRLTRSDDFKRVRRSGKSYAHPLLVLVVQAGEHDRLRVGVAATRSIGSAVHRNRAKRVMREAMRTLIPSLGTGWDIVCVARPPLLDCDMFQVREALLTLLRRAGLAASAPSDAA